MRNHFCAFLFCTLLTFPLTTSWVHAKTGIAILSMGIESKVVFPESTMLARMQSNDSKVFSTRENQELSAFNHDQNEFMILRNEYKSILKKNPILLAFENKLSDPRKNFWKMPGILLDNLSFRKQRKVDLILESMSGAAAVNYLSVVIKGDQSEIYPVVPMNIGIETFGLGSKLSSDQFEFMLEKLKSKLISENDFKMLATFQNLFLVENVRVVIVAQDINRDRIYRELKKRCSFLVSRKKVGELTDLYIRRAQILMELLNYENPNVAFVTTAGRQVDVMMKGEELEGRTDGWFKPDYKAPNLFVVGSLSYTDKVLHYTHFCHFSTKMVDVACPQSMELSHKLELKSQQQTSTTKKSFKYLHPYVSTYVVGYEMAKLFESYPHWTVDDAFLAIKSSSTSSTSCQPFVQNGLIWSPNLTE